jgi:signal transduction histidine kinase
MSVSAGVPKVVEVDRKMMHQVIVNAVSNAIKVSFSRSHLV